MIEDEICHIDLPDASKTAQNSSTEKKSRNMKNNIPIPHQEQNNAENKNKNGDDSSHMTSLEEVGSVDGATPEVASSEEDSSGGNTQTLNG